LRRYPRDSIAWVDLARLYTILGQKVQAERALMRALALAPNDRFTLRSAARYFLHVGDRERALSLIRETPASRSDPWLIAPEIAISLIAGRSSVLASVANREMSRAGWTKKALAEVQSSFGTLLLSDGADSRARQLFRRSLSDPTENVVAQAQWAAAKTSGLVVPSELLAIPRAYEAQALRACLDRQWDESVERSWEWAEYEPMSTRPLMFGSYIASVVFEDGATVLEFAERGLEVEPEDLMLRNNRIVGLAYSGRLEEAWSALETIVTEQAADGVKPFLFATTGLLCFRSGEVEKGREFYEKSMELPISKRDPMLKALALAHIAREEIRAETSVAAAALQRSEEACKGARLPELDTMCANLRAEYEHRQKQRK
jgi:Flp pilus assembly protein TadD